MNSQNSDVILWLSEEHLLIYQDNKHEISEGTVMVLNNTPEQKICLINLEEIDLDREVILENLYLADFFQGLLVLKLKEPRMTVDDFFNDYWE